jgi:hypothetical protein
MRGRSRRDLRHEWGGEGVDTHIERWKSAFATDGVTQQHDDKVDQDVSAKPTPSEAHTFFNRRKPRLRAENTVRRQLPPRTRTELKVRIEIGSGLLLEKTSHWSPTLLMLQDGMSSVG